CETLGVENRGAYYDRAGATRDMLQNHLLQLLCLVAMEPPAQFEAEAVRDEKVKILKALQPITGQDVQDKTVRGQYSAGKIGGQEVP
ncbi:glucose-6-phosphate dehydrogenase, partial [Pseudomonas frederiksbergensis]|nr:glucose-6-phosphate dehydrogenase [Pseudomonas frederiksbergensis]